MGSGGNRVRLHPHLDHCHPPQDMATLVGARGAVHNDGTFTRQEPPQLPPQSIRRAGAEHTERVRRHTCTSSASDQVLLLDTHEAGRARSTKLLPRLKCTKRMQPCRNNTKWHGCSRGRRQQKRGHTPPSSRNPRPSTVRSSVPSSNCNQRSSRLLITDLKLLDGGQAETS